MPCTPTLNPKDDPPSPDLLSFAEDGCTADGEFRFSQKLRFQERLEKVAKLKTGADSKLVNVVWQ